MKTPFYRDRRPPLDLLRDDFTEQIGLGEILGPDDDSIAPVAACG